MVGNRCLWLGPWSPKHNNIRYLELFQRLDSIKTIKVSTRLWFLRRIVNRLIGRRGEDDYLEPLIGYAISLISKRADLMLITDETLPYIDLVQCPVIVDDDDPILTPAHVQLLNHKRVIQVVTTSELLRSQLTSLGLQKPIVVIPSGVDSQGISHQTASAIRQELNPGNELVAVFAIPKIYVAEDVARLGSESSLRSIEFLLEVMEQVWLSQPNLQIWLIGTPSPAAIKRCAQYPQIRIVGYVEHGDILNYYTAADMGLYPRLSDFGGRHSIKLLEYMICGLPIVSTDVSEAYLVKEAQSGLTTSPNTSQEFAHCILQLAQDDTLRHQLAHCGRTFAKRYEWGSLAQEYQKLLVAP